MGQVIQLRKEQYGLPYDPSMPDLAAFLFEQAEERYAMDAIDRFTFKLMAILAIRVEDSLCGVEVAVHMPEVFKSVVMRDGIVLAGPIPDPNLREFIEGCREVETQFMGASLITARDGTLSAIHNGPMSPICTQIKRADYYVQFSFDWAHAPHIAQTTEAMRLKLTNKREVISFK